MSNFIKNLNLMPVPNNVQKVIDWLKSIKLNDDCKKKKK